MEDQDEGCTFISQDVLNKRLMSAVASGDPKQLVRLIQEGADVNTNTLFTQEKRDYLSNKFTTTAFGSALTVAVLNWDLEYANVLLRAGADVTASKIRKPLVIEAAKRVILNV